MLNSYIFNRIISVPFIRGFFPFYRTTSLIDPLKIEASKKMVWRNNYDSTLNISDNYRDRPLELGNFLYLRTRERDFLKSRILKTSEAVSTKNSYTIGSDAKTLDIVEDELFDGFDNLKTLLTILSTRENNDFPVSFASNVLYSLEKNGLRNEEMYEKVLFPVLKEKAQYLHADGLACAIWALGQYEWSDSELIETLLEYYDEKSYGADVMFLKNAKFSSDLYLSAHNSHTYEYDSSSEFKKLYFNDHISCIELFDGLRNISTQSLSDGASSKVNSVLADLEEKQAIVSDSYTYYKTMIEAPNSSS